MSVKVVSFGAHEAKKAVNAIIRVSLFVFILNVGFKAIKVGLFRPCATI